MPCSWSALPRKLSALRITSPNGIFSGNECITFIEKGGLNIPSFFLPLVPLSSPTLPLSSPVYFYTLLSPTAQPGQLVYFLGFGKSVEGNMKVYNPLLSDYKYYKKSTMEEISKYVCATPFLFLSMFLFNTPPFCPFQFYYLFSYLPFLPLTLQYASKKRCHTVKNICRCNALVLHDVVIQRSDPAHSSLCCFYVALFF